MQVDGISQWTFSAELNRSSVPSLTAPNRTTRSFALHTALHDSVLAVTSAASDADGALIAPRRATTARCSRWVTESPMSAEPCGLGGACRRVRSAVALLTVLASTQSTLGYSGVLRCTMSETAFGSSAAHSREYSAQRSARFRVKPKPNRRHRLGAFGAHVLPRLGLPQLAAVGAHALHRL